VIRINSVTKAGSADGTLIVQQTISQLADYTLTMATYFELFKSRMFGTTVENIPIWRSPLTKIGF
jgi:hypothetical protein